MIRRAVSTEDESVGWGLAEPGRILGISKTHQKMTPEKPVGTVYIAVATKDETRVKRLQLPPMRDREYIRTASATNALALLLEVKGIISAK